MRKALLGSIFIVAAGLCLNSPTLVGGAWAQPLTHTVVKGDTLWDLCEQYYGDPWLWPKLWEMNPFITNPHLLKPGDALTMLEGYPKKKPPIEKKKARPPIPLEELIPERIAIDVSVFAEVDTMGFLSKEEVIPAGHLVSSQTERVFLSEGDVIYIAMDTRYGVKPGDLFTVCSISPFLTQPLTGDFLGQVVSYLGKIAVTKHVEGAVYEAKIINSFRTIRVGDPVISYEPVSPCVQAMPTERKMVTNIVAVKDQVEAIGQHSVVYLERGHEDGIRRGNLFQIVQKHEIETPQKTTLPDIVLGYLLIVNARPYTATAVILESKKEVPNGTFVNSLTWADAQEFVEKIPQCPSE